MMIHAHTKFSLAVITTLVLIFTLTMNSPVQANEGVALSEHTRSVMKKQLEAGCIHGVTERTIASMYKKENANGQKTISEADFREKVLASEDWRDFSSSVLHSTCQCVLAKPIAELAAAKTDVDLIKFTRSMADYAEQLKGNPALVQNCAESAYNQDSPVRRRGKFAAVVLATSAAKIGVEICGLDRTTNPTGTWQISGCGAGNNGVPVDINNLPTSIVASVKTADNGVITATAGTVDGLNGETFILTPTFKEGRTFWRVSGTCLSSSPWLCSVPPGQK